jgi:serine/threonine protein kinase
MGRQFGNYEILRKLAAGGMAEVFLAKHRGLGGFERLVCIKRILPHLSEQEDFIRMFQDEARIVAKAAGQGHGLFGRRHVQGGDHAVAGRQRAQGGQQLLTVHEVLSGAGFALPPSGALVIPF